MLLLRAGSGPDRTCKPETAVGLIAILSFAMLLSSLHALPYQLFVKSRTTPTTNAVPHSRRVPCATTATRFASLL